MDISIGTFNLNNLFSRYNFKGEIEAIRRSDTGVESDILYEFGPQDNIRLRTYRGRLVKGKGVTDLGRIAHRITLNDVDVLAVQEVEDIDSLREFNRYSLSGKYRYVGLVEGNDPRLIDVGMLSNLPIGCMTSWQHTVHPSDPGQTVFSRDLVEIDIMNPDRSKRLFKIFNTHLKSHFVDPGSSQTTGQQQNDLRRTRQAEMIAEIVKKRTRPNSAFVITGDMNDPPDSTCLRPFVTDQEMDLVDGLSNPTETRPPKKDTPPPTTPAWTHRFKPSGQPAQYELYDHIWLSQSLANKQTGAWIDRRTRHSGDGSDHDPAWIEVHL